MKQNRTLLTFLGVMVGALLLLLLPDYFACNPIHFSKSPEEQHIEAIEVHDLEQSFGGMLQTIDVDYGSLTVSTLGQAKFEQYSALIRAWGAMFAKYHGAQTRDCVKVVMKDSNGKIYISCQSLDSMMRLVTNQGLCW